MNSKYFFLIFFQFILVPGKAQLNANEIYKISSSYIVLIEVEHPDKSISTGTGFYFADINAIVTNYHVIKDYEKIKLTYSNSKEFEGAFKIESDSTNDIAILNSTKGYNFTGGLRKNIEEYETGQKVYVIGNPLGLNNTVTEGIISSIRKNSKDEVIQFTAPVSHGSSGSPLLNENGQILGVVSFQISEGQNLNFAIPIKYVLDLASKYPPENNITEDETDGNYSAISTNKLMLLADSIFKKGGGIEETRIIKAILKRPDIHDSLFVIIALKAIKDKFSFDPEWNFLHGFGTKLIYYTYQVLSPDELGELLNRSIDLINNYSFDHKIITELLVITGYWLLAENDCKQANEIFYLAITYNDTSTIALNAMSDFYMTYSKEVLKTTDTNYVCKDNPSNIAEPDSVKYYLEKIVQYHPNLYNGYLKLIEFYLNRKSTKYYDPNIAFNYFLKCNKLDSQNPLALKTYLNRYFWSNKGTKNIAIYQKAENLYSKYIPSFEKKANMAKIFADNFKDNSYSYVYNSTERKALLNTAIKYYKKEISFSLSETKTNNYNSKNIATNQKPIDTAFYLALRNTFNEFEKKHPPKTEYLCNDYLNISELYMELKDFQSAYLYIDKSLRLDPDYYGNFKTLGNYYQNKIHPDYAEAIFSYKKYMETVPIPGYDLLTDLATCYYYILCTV